MTPGDNTGRMSSIFVSIPPVKRMIHNATIPICWATDTSSNCMPRPSVPNSMPANKNINRVGIPKR